MVGLVKFFRVFPLLEGVYLDYLVYRGSKAFDANKIEEVKNTDTVYRHIWKPHMGEGVDEIVAANFFQFQKSHNYNESLVWKRYAPDPNCVHSIGRIFEKRAKTNKQYIGSAQATVESVRSYETPSKKWKLDIIHAPNEGMFHLHIFPIPVGHNDAISKNERNELRDALMKIFKQRLLAK